MRRRAAAALALVVMSGACAHQRLGRPPSIEEIERVNDLADSKSMRIEYAAYEAEVASRGDLVLDPTSIESCDDRQITFRTADGARSIPSPLVAGVSFNDRPRGALIGAAAGVAFSALAIGGLYLLAATFPTDPGAPQTPCDNTCVASTVAKISVPFILLGTGLGYAIGARRTFYFGGTEPPASPGFAR